MSHFHSSSSALDILKKDHREIIAKFKLYEKLEDNEKRQQLAADICNSVIIHCTCEEELLYPMARQIADQSSMYVGEIELNYIKELISSINENIADDRERDALVKVLNKYTLAHLKQEETELFPLLKSSVLDLRKIGIAMLGLKLKMVERFREITEFEVLYFPVMKLN